MTMAMMTCSRGIARASRPLSSWSLSSSRRRLGSRLRRWPASSGRHASCAPSASSSSSTSSSSPSSSSSSSSSSSAAAATSTGTKASRRRAEILSSVEVVGASTGGPLPEDWNNKVLLIDKPLDWTSFDVCGKLRGLVRTKKVGHAGTLDPQATGLLIVCVGRATKTVDHYQGLGKAYEGTLRLGEATSSYDHCTPVERTAEWVHLSDGDITESASRFVGEIMQLPPMFSAIKRKGKKLYELARKGITVEREPRPVRVDEFRVWREEGGDPQTVNFYIRCGKGTYVRSLVHDLGEGMGTCAHMTSLRRTEIGEYSVASAWKLERLVEHLQRRRDEEDRLLAQKFSAKKF
mmetsp:Transcript_32694/g.70649  ORF Transcript_32694/g.70649 Transcript_32694/m.70649 type:complete len:349 (-) Transcript_32694:1118-2164(-)